MIRIPGVPFLPGTTFRDTTRRDFRRSQKFVTLNGVQMLADKPLDTDFKKNESSIYPIKCGPKLPPWIVYDKQVLCFFAYFKETLPEVYLASYQVRKVKILFYLEDSTMQVSEPRIENSGIPQGCLVSRQCIPRPAPYQNEFISLLDLNINRTIQIFDRVYHITGCDNFTRNFLNRAGIPVPDPVDVPTNPSEELRKKSLTRPKHPPVSKENNFEQFLKYDKQLLKFNGYWKDKSEFGQSHNLEIYYYLADDSVEIKEIFGRNSGRDGPTVFLKRGKLPKEWSGMPLPGASTTQRQVLNVLGGSFDKSRFLEDSWDFSRKVDYYKDCDFMIGQHLNVYGREIILTDCDEFTKDYYRKKYGVEEFPSLPNPALNIQKSQLQHDKNRELPPWNGWGTHEDSEQNCLTVEPKPPAVDMNKFLKFDRLILRFGAKMISRIKENCERIFIISYYLSDDTIQIYEIAERNSGFIGGEFYKRTKFFLPNQNLFTSKCPNIYRAHHFYIGATLKLRDYLFYIVSADEYTLLYMENHPYKFPYSNIEEIITKIRNALELASYKNFIANYIQDVQIINNSSIMTYDKIRKLLIDLLDKNITDHEIITVCRYFSALKKPTDNYYCNDREKIRSAAHWEIMRHLWNDFERLKEYICHLEKLSIKNVTSSTTKTTTTTLTTAFIDETKLRSIILGSHLPFNQELINAILSVLKRNSLCQIEICDFLNFIDIKQPIKIPIKPINLAFELRPKLPFLQSGLVVDWDKFIEKINLENYLKKQTV